MKPDLLQDVDQQRGAFSTSWAEANQGCLIQEFVRLRARLGVEEEKWAEEPAQPRDEPLEPPPAIDTLAAIFQLSVFERDLLLLKGAVPGPKGGLVLVRTAAKQLAGKEAS